MPSFAGVREGILEVEEMADVRDSVRVCSSAERGSGAMLMLWFGAGRRREMLKAKALVFFEGSTTGKNVSPSRERKGACPNEQML